MNRNSSITRRFRVRGVACLASLVAAMASSVFGQLTVTQPSPINIPDNDAAAPSSLSVSKVSGTIERLTVTLSNVKHDYVSDLGFMLVGPANQKVVLMSGAAAGSSLSGVTLTFTNGTSAPKLPAVGAITGSVFQPTDLATLTFPDAPAGANGTLADFVATSPNGTWKLLALDASPLNSGSVGSWSLNFWTTPKITLATNKVSIPENGTNTVNFTIEDSTANDTWKVTAVCADTALATNFVPTLTGTNGVLTIKPLFNAFGTNDVTVTVSDGIATHSQSFSLEVFHINQAPTFAINTNVVNTVAGMPTPWVMGVVNDPEKSPNLTFSISSDNPTLVSPSSGCFVGSSFSIVPNGTNTGTAKVAITVSDGESTNATATVNLTVNVAPATDRTILANTNALSVTETGTNSQVVVSNFVANVGRVAVSVSRLTNYLTENIDLVLAGPNNKTVVLYKGAAPGEVLTSNTIAQITFSDTNTASLTAASSLTNVLAKPVDSLATFAGASPNGTWTLYATNLATGGRSVVLGGWTLSIFAAPTISKISDVQMKEEGTNTLSFTVADVDGTVTNVTANLDDPTLAKAKVVKNGSAYDMTITGEPLKYGTTKINVVAQDNSGFKSTNTFGLALTFVNHAPLIDFIPKQVVRAGEPSTNIAFNVQDADLPAQTLKVAAVSSNQKVLPDSNILLQSVGNAYTMTLFPIGQPAAGDYPVVTVTVSDGNGGTAQSVFTLVTLDPNGTLTYVPDAILLNGSSVSNSTASPYPSTNNVKSLTGVISDLKVTLFGITHPRATNLNFLLVGPNGTNVLLMGHSGGNTELNNATLIFSDSGADLPENSQIISGTYHPTNYNEVAAFPTNAPKGPYGTSLSVFNGSHPTNDWFLYVFDDGTGKGGILKNGWQLNITTAPFVVSPGDQVTEENVSKSVTITVGDPQLSNIEVTATPTNSAVISDIVVSGEGATRKLLITPQPYTPRVSGSVTQEVTVVATDVVNKKSSTNVFNFIVNHRDQPPVFSGVSNQTTLAASPVTMKFSVWDPQTYPVTLAVASGDTRLIPDSNITKSSSVKDGTNYYELTILPSGVRTGTANIVLVASDDKGQKTSTSFSLTVTPVLGFASTNKISIPVGPIGMDSLTDQGAADPYPSTISVSNISGYVTGARVILDGFTHKYPKDVSVLLVSPDNKKQVVLMAHAGSSNNVSGLRLIFDDGAATYVPQTEQLLNGQYAPTNYASDLRFPQNSNSQPAGPFTSRLSDLKGVNPNGDWKLYVMDDTFPDLGSIENGWMLFLSTSPEIASIPDQTMTENGPALEVPFTVLDQSTDPTNVVVTVSHSDVPASLLSDIVVKTNKIVITLATNQPSASTITNFDGKSTISLVASNNGVCFTNSFKLTVKYVNQVPVVTTVTNAVTILENDDATVSFTLGDVDSKLYLTNISLVSAGDLVLLPNSTNNIRVVAGSDVKPGETGTVNVKITPAKFRYGTNTLSFVITDGVNFATNNLTINVAHVYQAPYADAITNKVEFVAGAASPVYPIKVHSYEVTGDKIYLKATSDNQSLIPDSNILLTQPTAEGDSAIQLIPVGVENGTAKITVSVWDAKTTNTPTSIAFNATIKPARQTQFGNPDSIGLTNALSNSVINVSGMVGQIFKVNVMLQGLSHKAPANLDVLLVHDDVAVMLLSGVGGTKPVSNLRLVFDNDGSALTAEGTLTSGTNQPTYVTKRTMPAPAPTGGYFSSLTNFNGGNPNGEWKLYLNDTNSADGGVLADGWVISIETTPTLTVNSGLPITLDENTATPLASASIAFAVEDSTTDASKLSVRVDSDNAQVAATFRTNSPGDYTATVTPALYYYGTNNVWISVTRPADGASVRTNVQIVVKGTNLPPTISRLEARTVEENATTPVTVEFLVADLDTALSAMKVEATSDNTALIGNTNLVFEGTGTNIMVGLPSSKLPQTSSLRIAILPNRNVFGTANITIKVTDPAAPGTNEITTSFAVNVTEVLYPPTIDAIAKQSVTSGSTISGIPVTVRSPNSTAPVLTVTATCSDTTIVKDSNIKILPSADTSTNRLMSIVSEAGKSGTVTITVTVKDDGNRKASTSFELYVRPARQHSFSYEKPITIRDNNSATPYPSTIDVSGLLGTVTKASVMLKGFGHQYPADVGVLLVSPAGSNVVLMAKAGGGSLVSGLDLTFSADATTAIPQSAALTSGVFLPANYKESSYNFPADAPVGPYSTSLGDLVGTRGNGVWSLYVVDYATGEYGSIAGGWTLTITTQPEIIGLTNLVTDENVSTQTRFSVADDSPAAPAFQLTAESGNEKVLPSTNITFTATDDTKTNYVITLTPGTNQFGTNIPVTVTVVNGDNQSVKQTFKVTVAAVNHAPTIDPLKDMTITAMTRGTNALSYTNVNVALSDLTLSVSSSNPTLIPTNRIVINGQKMIISPIGVTPGKAIITVVVKQADKIGGLSATNSFAVNVVASATPLYANTTGITINDRAPAAPDFPAVIAVSNVVGKVKSVKASLLGFRHAWPSDVSILLVGPANQKVVLMRNAGGGVSVSDLELTFDDAAPTAVPQSSALSTGGFKPADYKTSANFYSPAPAGPYGTKLSDFAGTNPNGNWQLFVEDDYYEQAGAIAGGWMLSIETDGPTISTIAGVTTLENVPTNVSVQVSSPVMDVTNLTVTAVAAESSPAGLIDSCKVTVNPTNAALRTIAITPAANMPSAVTNVDGTALITVSVTDTNSTVQTTTFAVTVKYVDQAPSITGLTDISTAANVPAEVQFSVNDVDTAVDSLVVSATSTNDSVGAIEMTTNGIKRVVTFTPTGTVGKTLVSITAADGTSTVTNSFVVTVTAGLPPVISAIGVQSTLENKDLVVSFTVANLSAGTNRTVTASSSNTNLVADVQVAGSGSNYTATVKLVAYANSQKDGTATVTIMAADEFGTNTSSFELSVAPVYYPPVFGPIQSAVTTKANTPVVVPLAISDPEIALTNLTLSASFSNSNLVSGVSFRIDGTNVAAVVNLVTNQVGGSAVTITVADGVSSLSQGFSLTVTAPAAPKLGLIANQSTQQNKAAVVALSVTSTETPISKLAFSATASSSTLVSGVTFANDGTNVSATVNVVSNAVGVATITVTVTDGITSDSKAFELQVNAPAPPKLGVIANQSIVQNKSAVVALSVTSTETPISKLAFSATSSNSNLVSGVTFANDGTNVTATVNVVSNATGVATITVTVTDGIASDSKSFDLEVKAPVPPTITYTYTAGSLVISWDATLGEGYKLQWSGDLNGGWVTSGVAPTISNGVASRTISTIDAIRFYRLIKQ